MTFETVEPALASPPPQLRCWHCTAVLGSLSELSPRTCATCKASTTCKDGIWGALSPHQLNHFNRFMTDYEFIRAAEGRGSLSPAYYLALPFSSAPHPLAAQWKIRARTFQYLTRHILPSSPQRILDLGAGNAWLSHRLSERGHHPVAVDLLTNSQDGLAAAVHYATFFPRVQSPLEQLPFADATFDLAIFNASFHYSENYRDTLAEALRCTRPGGLIVIADTPWYAEEASGIRMVKEKHAYFLSTYGVTSNALASQEFLTPPRLKSLAENFSLSWQTHRPFYGLSWSLRPLSALLKRQRRPSRFHLFVAEVPA